MSTSNASNSNTNETLQTVIDDHIKTRNAIYNDIAHPTQPSVSTALSTLLIPHTTTEELSNDPGPVELRALINTTLSELSPLARKTKYLEIQESFAQYYDQTSSTNEQVVNTYSDALDKANNELNKQHADLQDLETELQTARRGESTHYRQMTIAKYNLNSANYYTTLYTIYCVVLSLTLVVIGVLGQSMLGVLSRALCIIFTACVLVLLSMYTIYYVYFKHPVRDNLVWSKYKWTSSKPGASNCGGSRQSSTSLSNGDSVEQRAAAIARSTMA